MSRKALDFTHNVEYMDPKKGETIKVNLCFQTDEYAAMAARYLVDLMVHEAAGTDKPLDPALFKLRKAPYKSTPSRVRVIKRGGPPHPVEAFAPVEVPSTQPAPTAPPVEEPKAPAKAKARKKAKAEV